MFDDLSRPLLFAHRGASLAAPENTLEAFDLAVKTGADVLELDVHFSADGEAIVCHDDTLERTTDGCGSVRDYCVDDLKRLDAGYYFEMNGATPFRGQGVTLPTLAEVLATFPPGEEHTVGFNIEIKGGHPDLAATVLSTLQGMPASRVLLTAGDDTIMQHLEAVESPYPLGLSRSQVIRVLWGAYRGRISESFAGRALQIPPSRRGLPVATSRVIVAAQNAGLEVHVWTLNNARLVRRFLALGVDGVMTDDTPGLASLFENHHG